MMATKAGAPRNSTPPTTIERPHRHPCMTNDKDTAKAAPDDAPTLVLFRHDLRLADNLALSAAADCGRPVVAAFILDEESEGMRPLGGARRWWLHHSLCALAGRLSDLGAELVLRRGRMAETTATLAREPGAAPVF